MLPAVETHVCHIVIALKYMLGVLMFSLFWQNKIKLIYWVFGIMMIIKG